MDIIERLKAEICELRLLVAKQVGRIAELEKENRELREKLNTNSKNSSLPPSQDIHGKGKQKKSTGRKPGGQPGHPGHSRPLFPPERVSSQVDVRPDKCPNCGKIGFAAEPVRTEIKQVVDLPPIKPEITQYNIHTCRCDNCGKHVRPDDPPEARKGFGPRLMGFMTILSGECRLSKRLALRVLSYLGVKASVGLITKVHLLASKMLEGPYARIKTEVLSAAAVNGDETSWKTNGKKRWLWIGACSTATFYHIDASRSMEACKRVFVGFQGTLGSDRYNAYNQHLGDRQTCWAHLDRDFTKISERDGINKFIGEELLKQSEAMFVIWHQFRDGEISRRELQRRIETEVKPSVETLLKFGAIDSGVTKKTQATCLDLLNRFASLWVFVYQEGVEPTNNLAERGLRPGVIWRKLSFGTRSSGGERFVERILTIVMTCQQRAQNGLAYLQSCFEALIRDGPIPSVPEAAPLPP